MSLLGQTDWNGVDGQQPADGGWTPIPTGTYYFTIKSVQDKPTKNGMGAFTEIEFECLDEAHKGSKVYGRYNLSNKNLTAVHIARQEMKALGDALGVIPTSAEVLIGKVLKLEIECKQRTDDPTKMTNEIKRYLPSGQAPPVPQMEASTQQAAGASAAQPQDATPF